MKNVTRRIASTQSIALGAAWVTALIAPPAFAQQNIERVEITGSSIRRVDAETALPVQIVTRQEIEATGSANVEQFLHRARPRAGSRAFPCAAWVPSGPWC